jgi:hypothetical protein
MMKTRRVFAGVFLAASVLLAATAFAAEKTKIEIDKPMSVNGTQLAPGTYTVTWEGSGPSAQLKILKGKNVVATVPARIVNLKTATVNDTLDTRSEPSGVVLTKIEPGGKKIALVIGDESVQTAADAGNGK